MPEHLSLDQMKALGVVVDGRIMENGEKRFSIQIGSSKYIWTEPPVDRVPTWQEAHHHKGFLETYVVERGNMALAYTARPFGNGIEYRYVEIFGHGQTFTNQPGEDHNVFLFPGSAIHTIQHGEPMPNPLRKSKADWYEASPAFNEWSKSLSEAEIFRLNSQNKRRHA